MDRRAVLTEKMRNIREMLKPKLAMLLKEQHMVMTLDGWTDKSNRTYMSTTHWFIYKEWKLTARVYCLKRGFGKICGGGPEDARAECEDHRHGLRAVERSRRGAAWSQCR